MVAGHLGIVLLGKGIRRRIPISLLLAAALSSDLVSAVLVLTEVGDPGQMRSHSIPVVLPLAAGLALPYFAVTGDRRGTWLVALTSLSHVLTDYVTGIKPTWPGGPFIGLHLYRYPALDFVFEVTVVVVGWLVYRRSLGEEARRSWLIWAALGALVALQTVVTLHEELQRLFRLYTLR